MSTPTVGQGLEIFSRCLLPRGFIADLDLSTRSLEGVSIRSLASSSIYMLALRRVRSPKLIRRLLILMVKSMSLIAQSQGLLRAIARSIATLTAQSLGLFQTKRAFNKSNNSSPATSTSSQASCSPRTSPRSSHHAAKTKSDFGRRRIKRNS